MNKTFSLQPLMNLAKQQNDSATRKLGQLNNRQQIAQQKLDILLEYRKDYQTRLQKNTLSGMDPAGLRNFQQFINRLDEAIAQQLKAVEESKLSTTAGRGEYNNTRRKLKSFDTLQQRHTEIQKQAAGKSEQKATDEHSGRLAARKMLKSEEE